jgi:hypothetical protein
VLLPIVVIIIGDFPIGDIAVKGTLIPLALASVVVGFPAAEEGGVPLVVAEDEDGAGGKVHRCRRFQFF